LSTNEAQEKPDGKEKAWKKALLKKSADPAGLATEIDHEKRTPVKASSRHFS